MENHDQKVARINQLARKAKETGLTEDERLEQAALRREYIDAVKASLRATVESIEFVD